MTTTTIIGIEPHLPTIRLTVFDVHRRYHEYVSFDDLLSEAAVWWYGPGQKYLPEYLTEDEKHVRLRRSVWRFVARYAEKEKAHACGYEPKDQVTYHPQEILEVLPIALDPEGLPLSGAPSETRSAAADPALGNNALAVLVDVRRALATLTEDDLHFLSLVNDLHQDWDRIAAHTDTLADSARRRHLRIAERMARWLNKIEEDAA